MHVYELCTFYVILYIYMILELVRYFFKYNRESITRRFIQLHNPCGIFLPFFLLFFFFPSRAIYFRNVKNKRLVNTLTSVRKSFTFYAGNDIAHCSICSVSIFVSQRFSTKGRSSRRIRHSNSVIEMAQWRATRCCSSAFSYD